jgi:hypothetical protein
MGGGKGGKKYDSFAVLLYRRLRRGSGSLGREGRDEKVERWMDECSVTVSG